MYHICIFYVTKMKNQYIEHFSLCLGNHPTVNTYYSVTCARKSGRYLLLDCLRVNIYKSVRSVAYIQ